MTISMTREALLKILEERLADAKKEDERAAKAHKKEEEAALRKWKDGIRKASVRLLPVTYDQWKKLDWRQKEIPSLDQPSCPMRHAVGIQAIIDRVNMDMRKANFQVRDRSDVSNAINWLPPSKRKSETVCD